MGEVSRQDIEEAVLTNDFHYDYFVSLITRHIEIQIPDKFAVLQKKFNEDKKIQEEFTPADDILRHELIDYVYGEIERLNKAEEDSEPVNESSEPPLVVTESEGEVESDVPDIKINLNLGSDDLSEPSSAEDTSSEESEVEGGGGSDQDHLDGESTPLRPASPSIDSSTTDLNPRPTELSSSPPYADRKSHISALVKESKWTIKQITQIIDDQWGYAAQGKSSKTRVSKTIRDLRDANLVYEESNGVLTWRGE